MPRFPIRLQSLVGCRRISAGLTPLLAVLGFAALAAEGPSARADDGWNPFSQLETNRWERRSKNPASGSSRSAPATGVNDRGSPGPSGDDGAASGNGAPAVAPPNAYLEAPQRQPAFRDTSETYYPPPRNEAQAPPGQGYDAAPDRGAMETRRPDVRQDSRRATRFPEADNGASPSGYSAPAIYRDKAREPLPPAALPGAVQRGELQPVMATDGSNLPYELWRGLDNATVERLIASLTIPPRSPALHDLWRRLITSDVQPPSGDSGNAHFAALRLEALYRSGMLSEIQQSLARSPAGDHSPLLAMLLARSEIGLGRREAGCATARKIADIAGEIPKSLRGEAILVSGYCAAASGNKPAAGLLAGLAREEGLTSTPGLAALDAVALGVPSDISLAKGQRLSLIDYRILELAGATPPAEEVARVAAPALLVALATDTAATEEVRLEAAEAAARINALPPDMLATAYQQASGRIASSANAVESSPGGKETARRRALLYASAAAERTPAKKVRLIRAFLDSAKRSDLYFPALVLAAKLTGDVGLVPEISWFAETAIEANLAAGNYQRARMWTKFSASIDNGRGSNLAHWQALIDIADVDYPETRGAALEQIERMALSGRFASDMLHRVATVLDALEYNVPIPLWEAASRTPQPSSGHLPETGVLTELQDAAKKKEFGRTVLLAMQTLGPGGADGAHMIALGDSIRALRRAGLEKDARRLGFEALLAGWPRMVTQ